MARTQEKDWKIVNKNDIIKYAEKADVSIQDFSEELIKKLEEKGRDKIAKHFQNEMKDYLPNKNKAYQLK